MLVVLPAYDPFALSATPPRFVQKPHPYLAFFFAWRATRLGGDKPAPYAGVPTRHPMGSQNALFLNFLKFGKFPVASPFGLHNYVNFEIHGVHQRAQMAYCF